MSNPSQMKTAADIVVSRFRQILVWPLFLHKVEKGTKKSPLPSDFLDVVTGELKKGGWEWVDREERTAKLEGLPWYKDEQDYSEIVYFHSFVRDFLYGGDGTKAEDRPMRVFRRNDVSLFQVVLRGGMTYGLTVERSELYLFESGVLILALEVEESKRPDGERIKLNEVIDLQSMLRMAFPRRWSSDGKPSECPLKIELIKLEEATEGKEATKKTLAFQDYEKKPAFTTIVRATAELPAAAHLQFLLRPLGLYGESVEGYSYQQIEDQRIPSMSYLAVKDPREITDWDYARLTFYDESGESAVGSYSDVYLADWQKTSAYDRFWQRTPSRGRLRWSQEA